VVVREEGVQGCGQRALWREGRFSGAGHPILVNFLVGIK
jgi:hypothetical protein